MAVLLGRNQTRAMPAGIGGMCALTVVWLMTGLLGQKSDRPSTTIWAKTTPPLGVLPWNAAPGALMQPRQFRFRSRPSQALAHSSRHS
jgi:hypothetical protein